MNGYINKTMNRTRVLIADDSALMRKLLTEILDSDPEIEVVGTASDAFKAREEIKRLDPDVLTLDVEMPKMDGISFLEKLMRLRPMPVVMISAMTEKGADTTMRALMLGAVDFITKPKVDIGNSIRSYAELICTTVKTAAAAKPIRRCKSTVTSLKTNASLPATQNKRKFDLVAIGASTGGVEAVHTVLSALPEDMPPIVVTQHIPPIFSTSFAKRLNDQIRLNVREATHGEKLEPGTVYIAPGDQHLLVQRDGSEFVCALNDDAPVNRHMPSVDVLFESVARTAGKRAIGMLLTGMGSDGARGLLNMKQRGAVTIAQDQQTSIVWGMPREAVEIGAAQHVLPLSGMAGKLQDLSTRIEIKGDSRVGIGRQAKSKA